MILECVPNLSEGRRREVIDRLARAAGSGGAALLHRTSDPDHHRTVLTLAGEPRALEAALLALFAAAVDALDLRLHRGAHPRIGALDVVPFVPLSGASMADARRLAERLGERVGERFELPVFLYQEATAADRAARLGGPLELARLRRGGLAGLERRLRSPAWRPDFGPPRLHPTAGATAIGARRLLIAFNVVLASADLALARRVAAAVRESAPGGLPAVRALGVELSSRGLVQVSMNLLDFRRTPPRAAFERVEREAARHGARVVASEIVGLVPEAALDGDARRRLRLERFSGRQILERRLEAAGL